MEKKFFTGDKFELFCSYLKENMINEFNNVQMEIAFCQALKEVPEATREKFFCDFCWRYNASVKFSHEYKESVNNAINIGWLKLEPLTCNILIKSNLQDVMKIRNKYPADMKSAYRKFTRLVIGYYKKLEQTQQL